MQCRVFTNPQNKVVFQYNSAFCASNRCIGHVIKSPSYVGRKIIVEYTLGKRNANTDKYNKILFFKLKHFMILSTSISNMLDEFWNIIDLKKRFFCFCLYSEGEQTIKPLDAYLLLWKNSSLSWYITIISQGIF